MFLNGAENAPGPLQAPHRTPPKKIGSEALFGDHTPMQYTTFVDKRNSNIAQKTINTSRGEHPATAAKPNTGAMPKPEVAALCQQQCSAFKSWIIA